MANLTYQDKWSRYHDKLVTDFKPIPSNNSWIFSAYAAKLGLPLDEQKLRQCFKLCKLSVAPLHLVRSPDDHEPPMSKDEILGLSYLNLLPVHILQLNDWDFCPYEIPKFNLVKTVQAFIRLSKADRNAIWENGGEPHAFRFAFKVSIVDRVFMLKKAGKKVPVHYSIFAFFSKMLTKQTDSIKLMEWLKSDEKPDLALFERYFGKYHVFCNKIRNN